MAAQQRNTARRTRKSRASVAKYNQSVRTMATVRSIGQKRLQAEVHRLCLFDTNCLTGYSAGAGRRILLEAASRPWSKGDDCPPFSTPLDCPANTRHGAVA